MKTEAKEQIKKLIEDTEEEYKKINNELVVKSYRDFCKENGLKFHFWDELPEDAFDPEISEKEFWLHNEAMDCFNNLKPRFVLFDNKIYSFHFTEWGGGFRDESWEVQDFFNKAYDEMNKAKVYKQQAEITVGFLIIGSALLIISLTILLDVKFFKLPISWLSMVTGIGLSVLASHLIKRKLLYIPIEKINSEKDEYVKRLLKLKQQFIQKEHDSKR